MFSSFTFWVNQAEHPVFGFQLQFLEEDKLLSLLATLRQGNSKHN